jgi:F0F1-type ATP synthase membrane subunit a
LSQWKSSLVANEEQKWAQSQSRLKIHALADIQRWFHAWCSDIQATTMAGTVSHLYMYISIREKERKYFKEWLERFVDA